MADIVRGTNRTYGEIGDALEGDLKLLPLTGQSNLICEQLQLMRNGSTATKLFWSRQAGSMSCANVAQEQPPSGVRHSTRTHAGNSSSFTQSEKSMKISPSQKERRLGWRVA
jgi:hypothetical protein